MSTSRTERITAGDGGVFDGHLVLPESGSGPGLLVIQEIFGVNSYVKSVADRLAAMGYVAMAPDVFWRQKPNIALEGSSDEAIGEGVGYAGAWFGSDDGLPDISAALDHLRALPETGGKAGIIGFCFGGSVAWLAARELSPDVAVSYYGSAVPGMLEGLEKVTCPVLLQFGGDDPFLPRESVDAVASAVAPLANVRCEIHEGAGHAFDNHLSERFSQPEHAAAAWAITTEFLAEHLS